MAAPPSTPPRCTTPTCPLNEAGIAHAQGIYKHKGQDNPGLCIVFANSNPPGFVWRAWERYCDLERAIRKGKRSGQDVEGLVGERDGHGAGRLVERFLDHHCGCNRCLEGGRH